MDRITQILEDVVRCKYSEVGVHVKNPIKNSYKDGLGRTTQTLDHVVVVHILIWDKRKSQCNEYNLVKFSACRFILESLSGSPRLYKSPGGSLGGGNISGDR